MANKNSIPIEQLYKWLEIANAATEGIWDINNKNDAAFHLMAREAMPVLIKEYIELCRDFRDAIKELQIARNALKGGADV